MPNALRKAANEPRREPHAPGLRPATPQRLPRSIALYLPRGGGMSSGATREVERGDFDS